MGRSKCFDDSVDQILDVGASKQVLSPAECVRSLLAGELRHALSDGIVQEYIQFKNMVFAVWNDRGVLVGQQPLVRQNKQPVNGSEPRIVCDLDVETAGLQCLPNADPYGAGEGGRRAGINNAVQKIYQGLFGAVAFLPQAAQGVIIAPSGLLQMLLAAKQPLSAVFESIRKQGGKYRIAHLEIGILVRVGRIDGCHVGVKNKAGPHTLKLFSVVRHKDVLPFTKFLYEYINIYRAICQYIKVQILQKKAKPLHLVDERFCCSRLSVTWGTPARRLFPPLRREIPSACRSPRTA